MSDFFDDIFNEVFGNNVSSRTSRRRYHKKQITPEKFERMIDENNIYYTFELRPYTREEIDIKIEDNILYVTLLNKDGYNEDEEIIIPHEINEENVTIDFNNGILDIICPIKNK